MLQLNSESLSDATQLQLDKFQQRNATELDFTEKVKKTIALWDSKSGSVQGKLAFKEIKTTLLRICKGVELCAYCESNEATDIEHLRPKSLFPEDAFSWINYVLACKNCNTTFKSDKSAIFNPIGSAIFLDITPNKSNKIKVKPANNDTLFINPRIENPTRLILLDLVEKTFLYIPKKEEGTRDFLKADYTINTILKLNNRVALVESRKSAFIDFQNLLRNYIAVGIAQTHDELEAATGDFPQVNFSTPLIVEKKRIQNHIKNALKTHSQPTVWLEMKRQRAKLPQTSLLFKKAPESLKW
jgi:uncharacterized protein (TIGR02646 family)